ncbi:hypothetical protein AOQ84DRAFT_159680 [Glonium stellatum]|uniref:Uncharacterized protein n=1 Tax=Glonium stellatum TaxID=574774 RepID=A0A8E2F8I3_9PEZI|nr:hypothetical protein AOQ84DRAFT_159680 [Glonium stellatum]
MHRPARGRFLSNEPWPKPTVRLGEYFFDGLRGRYQPQVLGFPLFLRLVPPHHRLRPSISCHNPPNASHPTVLADNSDQQPPSKPRFSSIVGFATSLPAAISFIWHIFIFSMPKSYVPVARTSLMQLENNSWGHTVLYEAALLAFRNAAILPGTG